MKLRNHIDYNIKNEILATYIGRSRVVRDLFLGKIERLLIGDLIVGNGLRIELDIESVRKLSINIILEPNGQTNQEG